MIRIAHAHYLTLEELLKLTGLCWYRLDEGSPDQVEVLSRMLGAPVDAARRNLRRDPEALPPSPAYSWVVCPHCFDGDVASKRTPYIRVAWSDPLATYCLEHNLPLMPQHQRDAFGKMFSEVADMFEVSSYQYVRDLDVYDMEALRVFALGARRPVTKSTERKIREVSDIAAALLLPADRYYPRSVIDRLNYQFGRRVTIRPCEDFEPDMAWAYWAPWRLALLRAALSLLERPRKPGRAGAGVHRYGRWLTKGSRGIRAPRQSLRDPLLFLAVTLSTEDRRILTDRSAAWRPPIRARWRDCLVLIDQL